MMSWTTLFGNCCVATSLLLVQGAFAQSLGTGSISGYVLSEEGRTVRASVTLSFAAARGYPSPPRRVFTGTNGAFTFSRLPAGRYVLCAQAFPGQAFPGQATQPPSVRRRDSYGNTIAIQYAQGAGGATTNTSGRIRRWFMGGGRVWRGRRLSRLSLNHSSSCYSGSRQFVIKRSVGLNVNGSGAPAFIFEQQRNPTSDPAVTDIR
jgi:hypothetical protein